MKNIKLSHLIFSLALIAALTVAAVPAPVHALAGSSASAASIAGANTGIVASQSSVTAASRTVWVCRPVVVWRHGHRFVLRQCHRVVRPLAQ
jgi:hypothetical protein